jgi:hypothetical protein
VSEVRCYGGDVPSLQGRLTHFAGLGIMTL